MNQVRYVLIGPAGMVEVVSTTRVVNRVRRTDRQAILITHLFHVDFQNISNLCLNCVGWFCLKSDGFVYCTLADLRRYEYIKYYVQVHTPGSY